MTEGFVAFFDNKRYLVQSWRYRVSEHAILVLHDAIRVASNIDDFLVQTRKNNEKQNFKNKFRVWNTYDDDAYDFQFRAPNPPPA